MVDTLAWVSNLDESKELEIIQMTKHIEFRVYNSVTNELVDATFDREDIADMVNILQTWLETHKEA